MEALHGYDYGQTIESWIFIIAGILSIALALFFVLIIKYSFFKGMGLIFLTAGILEIAAGIFTWFPYLQLHLKGGTLTNDSLIYLGKQISQIEIYLWISIVNMAVGIVLYSLFFRSVQTFWKGIGLGLMIQGLLLSGLFGMKYTGFKSYKAMVTQPMTEAT